MLLEDRGRSERCAALVFVREDGGAGKARLVQAGMAVAPTCSRVTKMLTEKLQLKT